MIIDCFPFFNEKELLELRINLLKHKVDKFLITELNYTHSGLPKEFSCRKIIRELNLPSEMIEVIEINLNDADSIKVQDIDMQNASQANSAKEVTAWSRERIQRDAVVKVIDRYPDDAMFIVSDCDEMIDPEVVDYVCKLVKNSDVIIKVPLVLLEGRADRRLYNPDGSIVPWDCSLFVCKKTHLKEVTPTQIRSNIDNHFGFARIVENNIAVSDLGWHFTWMGDAARKKEKAEAYIHYANMDVVNNISQDSAKDIQKNINSQYITKPFPREKLPEKIYQLLRVSNFLLPKT